MNVYRSKELDLSKSRAFPWIDAVYNTSCRYHDFKAHPELIATSLEDFLPWSRYPAVQLFYDTLRWLNGPASHLETDDCAFSGVLRNNSPQFEKAKQADGRLMLFFRQLEMNCEPHCTNWLKETFGYYLERAEPDFEWGCVGLSTAPVFFTEAGRKGRNLILNFWSWGDTENETLDNLTAVFRAISSAAHSISQEIAYATSATPAARRPQRLSAL